jgi:hypothetical protein
MVAAVQRGVAYEPIGGEAPANFDVTQVFFGRPLFTDVQPDTKPQGDIIWLASGTTQLCAWWEYQNMADGVRWDGIWALEGTVQEEVSYLNEVWSGGANGEWWACVSSEEPINEGLWDLTLNVEGELVGGGFVGVGDALEPVAFTFTNASPNEVCYLYISPDVTTFWGADWLGPQETVLPSGSVSYDLPPTTYDLRGDDCQHNVLFEDTQEIAGPATYTYQ